MVFFHRLLFGVRRDRVFYERKRLDMVPDFELRHYRLSRGIIQDLINEYSQSVYANTTERSHAVPPDTQVCNRTYPSSLFKILFGANKHLKRLSSA